jgi:hypothetical protein
VPKGVRQDHRPRLSAIDQTTDPMVSSAPMVKALKGQHPDVRIGDQAHFAFGHGERVTWGKSQ